jgi:hypothetical protein
MKYFLDTEFIEGFHKPLFGKKRHFIDLISIGIVCEDGREYYAISNEFRERDADIWVKQNVISKLDSKNTFRAGMITPTMHFAGPVWKSNESIKKDLLTFFGCKRDQLFWRAPEGIEVFGYYSDYDWVLFCSLFGRMIDLPKGFPMYCIDLKQTLDEKAIEMNQFEMTTQLVSETNGAWQVKSPLPKEIINIDGWSFGQKLEFIKSHKSYPKQSNEHNALADAKWNYKLFKFLQSL